MTLIASRFALAGIAAAAAAMQPTLVQAQQSCITEAEVTAMSIYSMPSLVQSMRLQCGASLSPSGFLARRGDAFAASYARLQNATWPRAKSGLLKYGARHTGAGSQDLSTFANLPDTTVRPLVDALIVQEAAAKIEQKDCWKIERMMEAVAPVDPEVAGTLIGVAVGLFAPEDQPICSARRS